MSETFEQRIRNFGFAQYERWIGGKVRYVPEGSACKIAAEELERLRRFYRASQALTATLGHPDATSDDERAAESEYEAARAAVEAGAG